MEINVVEVLREKRRQLHQELETIDKAIELLNGGNASRRAKRTTRRPMSEAMKAKIGRGVRRALRRKNAKARAEVRK